MALLQLTIGLGDILQAAKGMDMNQVGTKGCMKNETNTMMKYSSSKDWDGTPMCYPPTIPAHSSVKFIHKADPCKGSKEGVVYFGTNNQCTPCAWLMAWYAPNNPCAQTPNKANDPLQEEDYSATVYVECGPKEKYECIDWGTIEKKLEASSSHSSYKDKCTGATAEATIDDCCQFASLAACFGADCPCN